MFEVKEIYKNYGRKKVLKGASFFANKGDCVGIVGANGCGKSTLLGILSGSLKQNSGEILIENESPFKNRTLFSTIIGFVPQDNPLIAELSVKDNLKLWYCNNSENIDTLLQKGLLKQLGLEEYKNTPINKLSGGLKKRVSIACALANDPSLLILDEPGAALDLVCKEEIKDYLKEFMKAGKTIIITTHDESELSICNRLYLIKDGQLSEIPATISRTDLLNKIISK